MKNRTLVLATALLMLPGLPLVAAGGGGAVGGAIETVAGPEECTGPTVEWLVCYVEEKIEDIKNDPAVKRVEYEVAWHEALVNGYKTTTLGSAADLADATLDAGFAQLDVTIDFYDGTQANVVLVTNYANGVPLRATTYVGGVVAGECVFLLGGPCPAPATMRSAGGGMLDVNCPGLIPTLVCIVQMTAAHYLGVANGAVVYADNEQRAAGNAGKAYATAQTGTTVLFVGGTGGVALAYGEASWDVAWNQYVATAGVATAECMHLVGGSFCPVVNTVNPRPFDRIDPIFHALA